MPIIQRTAEDDVLNSNGEDYKTNGLDGNDLFVGDGLADPIVGAYREDPHYNADVEKNYVEFGDVDHLSTAGDDSTSGTTTDEILVGAKGNDALFVDDVAGYDLHTVADVHFHQVVGGSCTDSRVSYGWCRRGRLVGHGCPQMA